MSEVSIPQLVGLIHDQPTKVVLAITGGGSRAIAELLEVPGGSRTLIEGVVPYSAAALIHWLGGRPDQFCSSRTGRAMAMAAYQRGKEFGAASIPPVPADLVAGVACTASLASDVPKKGPHRIHVAWQSASVTSSCSLELVKGRRDRRAEEDLATRLVLNAAAEACGLSERVELALAESERVESSQVAAPLPWQELLAGRTARVCQGNATAKPQAMFPGAFNPLHEGHAQMAAVAVELLGAPVDFEISILNVDKPPLDFQEIQQRTAQFSASETLWLTRAATFVEKSRLFPGVTFVVGADTIARIAEPRYYGDDVMARDWALNEIAHNGGKFLVFGRLVNGKFLSLGELSLPTALMALCRAVPSDKFRADISSSELRNRE